MHKDFPLSLAVFFLSTAFFPSCKKPTITSNEDLVGNWTWLKTEGGFGNHIHETPASTGRNIVFRFTSDNRYFMYTNGALSNQGTFNVENGLCIHDHENKKVIQFSEPGLQNMMIENMDSRYLNLSDEAFDGLGSLYAK